MARHVIEEGLALIKRWEGLKTTAYLCTGGKWTIGYGHTRTARPGMVITTAEAERLLRMDLREAEEAIDDAVTVDLTDNQYAALVSWCFNVGAGAAKTSTLVRKLNAGDYNAVPTELARWNRSGGKVTNGLVNRRAAEIGLWAKGAFVASRDVTPTPVLPAATVATTTGTGKAALTIGAAGVASTVAQAAPAIQAMGALGPVVGVALIAAAVVLFVLWRRGRL